MPEYFGAKETMNSKMPRRTFVGALSAAVVCIVPCNAAQPIIKGTEISRLMLVEGVVLGMHGQPAEDAELLAFQKRQAGRESLKVTLQGSRFKSWVPINGSEWFYVELSASSNGGKQRAFQGIANRQLRQAAIDGVVLQLAEANRSIKVSVVNDEQPVPGAHVTAQTRGNELLHGNTDGEGNVVFHLLPDEKLGQLTAWTDDYLLGGYSFHRKPRRDPLGTEHTIELENCRDQIIRLLHA